MYYVLYKAIVITCWAGRRLFISVIARASEASNKRKRGKIIKSGICDIIFVKYLIVDYTTGSKYIVVGRALDLNNNID